jgi:integrase
MTKATRIHGVRIRPHKRDGKNTGQWVVDIPPHVSGTGRRRLLFDNVREAKEFAAELAQRVCQTASTSSPPTASAILTVHLDDAIRRWREYQEALVLARSKAASSLATDLHRLAAVRKVLGNCPIGSIGIAEIERFQQSRARAGCSAATINTDVGALIALLRWATDRGWLATVPRAKRLRFTPRNRAVPTPAEVVRIVRLLPPMQALAVQLLAETGCRLGEALHLGWDCVDLERRSIAIRPGAGGWTPKTEASERTIPITVELAAGLRQLPRRGPYVFHGSDPSKPLTSIKRVLATASEQAAILRDGQPLRVTPQLLRKAFATWQAQSGTAPKTLQRLLGHAPGSRVTDRYYVQDDEAAKQRAIRPLPLLESDPVQRKNWQQVGNALPNASAKRIANDR